MNFLKRLAERLLGAVLVGTIIWVGVTLVFDSYELQSLVFLVLCLAYIAAAYVILPPITRAVINMLNRGRFPHVTRSSDGLAADPINVILIGSFEDLKYAFGRAGWHIAEPLTLRTAWKMGIAFIGNLPYPTAPFSAQYLFGRKQDIGFQEAIGPSPRARHHVRFWKASQEFGFTKTAWVGAGVKDTGFGLARITYQITHRVDPDIDREREYILESLRQTGLIKKEQYVAAGQHITDKYQTDGQIVVAELWVP